jgi:putative FmdB family regulatory protein
MPLYEYSCQRCGKLFEVLQKFSDPALSEHEECGGPVERLVSPPALQFKGTGWYVTDYARGSGGSSNGSNGKPEGKTPAAKPESKTESKGSDAKPASSTSTAAD